VPGHVCLTVDLVCKMKDSKLFLTFVDLLDFVIVSVTFLSIDYHEEFSLFINLNLAIGLKMYEPTLRNLPFNVLLIFIT